MSQINISFAPGVVSAIQSALDQVTNLEARACTLYFPPVPIPISGAQSFNPPVGTDITNNTWAAGMPMPLNSQQNFNPYSDGQNIAQIEPTGTIAMVIYPNPNRFNDVFPLGERKEEGMIITRGYVSDIPKILNCTRMETFIEAGTTHYKYKLDGEPVMMGTLIPTRYFYALWQRL
jgi:hypothetical protein